jgi:hypothetical protein
MLVHFHAHCEQNLTVEGYQLSWIVLVREESQKGAVDEEEGSFGQRVAHAPAHHSFEPE